MLYALTAFAKEDIVEIIHYTMKNWGADAEEKYMDGLSNKLDAIDKSLVVKDHYTGKISNLFVSRFRYHQIYYLDYEDSIPTIVRILHGKQDRVRHIEKAFSKLYWERGDEPIGLL